MKLMKKNIKKIYSITLAIILVFTLSISAMAFDQDFTVGKTFAWSPDCTTTAICGQTVSGGTTRNHVSAVSNFSWTTTAANLINQIYFTTIEQNSIDGTPMTVYSQYCPYPNIHFDLDDDDGDGNNEESEAVFLNKITANTNYTFITNYTKTSSTYRSGGFNTIVQRSIWAIEYQALEWDLLNEAFWTWPWARGTADNGTTENNEITADAMKTNLVLHQADMSKSELDMYFANQKDSFDSLQTQQRSQIMEAGDSVSTEVTVTFTSPISMNQMLTLINDVGGTLKHYQAKFTNSEGNWCTVGSAETDESAMVAWANQCATDIDKPHTSYDGIVSMQVIIPATEAAYDLLSNSSLVYYVDLSAYLYQNSDSYDTTVDIVVPDYAWEVANFG
jgi:hypothetical protein